jgi:ubiquinone/menaquinone biosynthesis C-methylase UbiE
LTDYLMENQQEALRLDMKTDFNSLHRQAVWAGLKQGMSVADIGCGSGITSSFLKEIVGPTGKVTGIDASEERIAHARQKYEVPGLTFCRRDARESLDDVGQFDFIWMRFFLEYHRTKSFDIVRSASRLLKPGGILCLIDLDYNSLSHFGLSEKLEKTLHEVMNSLELNSDFDPFVGRKLYSYLYDMGYQEIDVDVAAHHLIFGPLKEVDAFNWMKKAEVAAERSGHLFADYAGGLQGFLEEFRAFFSDPRRFTYTPIISCRGRKP